MKKFNQYLKSDEARFFIDSDLVCLIEKTDGCKNNPKYSSTTKVAKHIPSDFSMSAKPSFKRIEKSMMYAEVKIA